jgi:hypothetical protein
LFTGIDQPRLGGGGQIGAGIMLAMGVKAGHGSNIGRERT